MNEILNYFVKSLAAKSLTLKKKSILIEKPWALIDDDGEIQKLIFKRDKGLILSKNGVVTIGSWDYYPEARALLIDRNTDKLLLKEQYIDDNVLILKKDGTDNDFFALANENTLPDYNVPKYLNSLKCKEFGIYETKLLNGYILQIHGGPRYQLYNGLNGHDVTQIDNNNYNSIDLNDGAYMTEDKKYTLYIQDGKTASIKINFLKKLANGDIVEIENYDYGNFYNNIGKKITLNGNPLPNKRLQGSDNYILEIRESKIVEILVIKKYELKNGLKIKIEQKNDNRISKGDKIIFTEFGDGLVNGAYNIKGKFKKINIRNNVVV